MRIAIFSDCYYPAINGVVTSIGQQAEILSAMGHEFEIFCPRYERALEEEQGVRRLAAIPFPFHKREQFSFPWPPKTLKDMWTGDFDLVHLQTPFSVGLTGMAMAWTRGIPRVFHHHTLWEEYVDYLPIPKGICSALSVALCRSVANACQGVVAPSLQVKERFQEQGVRVPISVIPTGIRSERFQNGTVKDEKEPGHEICLYMGRLAHEKSLDALIRVFHRIHQQRETSRLWLVGDGPARADLEHQVAELGLQEVVRFFGFVPRETLRDFVASARVFLFTSLTETQGLVLLEAQAGGLPVVAFAASGVNEAVHDGRTGFLVEAGREELLASQALRILADEKLRIRCSQEAVEWSENFSLRRMGEQLVGTYERAVEACQNGEK